MKKIHITLFSVISLLFVTSCDDYLHKDPIGLLTPDNVNTNPTLTSVQYSVNSTYQMLASTLNLLGDWAWDDGTVTRNDFVVYDLASDDALKKWNPDGDQPWMDEIQNYSYIASNTAFNGFWSYQYEGVSRANLALSYLMDDKIIEAVGMDASLRKRLLGETYFLRAFYYFDLVTNFGDVPFLIAPIKDFEDAYKVSERTDKEIVWEQIMNDLEDAKGNLPLTKFSSESEPWRVSLGAVLAMQAKVALYRKDYPGVLSAIKELEDKGFYRLNSNYFDSFSQYHEFTDNEVVFAYDHKEKMTPAQGNGLCALLGWGFFAPSKSFIKEFEPNDPRLNLTVDVEKQLVYKILGDLSNKNQGYDDAPSNKVYIRYADVMLWKAEALIETGKVSDAIDIINEVRERARNTVGVDGETKAPAGTLPDRDRLGSKEQAWEWLIHERRVELGLESHRFRDLKRWGIAKKVLNANGQAFTDRNYLFPIPQKDIDKSGGKLIQNPGY